MMRTHKAQAWMGISQVKDSTGLTRSVFWLVWLGTAYSLYDAGKLLLIWSEPYFIVPTNPHPEKGLAKNRFPRKTKIYNIDEVCGALHNSRRETSDLFRRTRHKIILLVLQFSQAKTLQQTPYTLVYECISTQRYKGKNVKSRKYEKKTKQKKEQSKQHRHTKHIRSTCITTTRPSHNMLPHIRSVGFAKQQWRWRKQAKHK